MTPTGASAFTTTQGVVDGVRGNAADLGTLGTISVPAGFSDLDILVLNIAYLAHSGHASGKDLAGFSGRKANKGKLALPVYNLSVGSG